MKIKFDIDSLSLLQEALRELEKEFSFLPEFTVDFEPDRIRPVLRETAERLKDNYPYFHPFYAGQMMKPPHPVARLAYMLAMWINPNNHALDGGRASSIMEKEAVAALASMFGWTQHMGHLCSGGTVANLEALWIAGKLNPDKIIVASQQAHYTHQRISEILRLKFEPVPCDSDARISIEALERMLKKRNVGTVVATIGTTGTGSVDPLDEIMQLKKKYSFRIHADAAYGGYFTLIDNIDAHTKAAYHELSNVDSLVIDPHKHGLQPYGCGCVLFDDPQVGAFYRHDSPYTYFSSSELHLGEISVECSRAGAAAVALWATQRLLPMQRGGEFALNLAKSRDAAVHWYRKLSDERRWRTLFEPQLDIVVWAPRAEKASRISALTDRLFDACAQKNLHFAKFQYPSSLLKNLWKDVTFDQESVTCLRSCLIKPHHHDWLETIWNKFSTIMDSMEIAL